LASMSFSTRSVRRDQLDCHVEVLAADLAPVRFRWAQRDFLRTFCGLKPLAKVY
jgi:hypothetical protein